MIKKLIKFGVDWGVFHVEPGFLTSWSRYARALKQRNSALRLRNTDILDSLDATICPPALELTAQRSSHAEAIKLSLAEFSSRLSPALSELTVDFHQGWSEGSYSEVLALNRQNDIDRGVSRLGPHRADLSLSIASVPARAVLSRGEQKSLAAALLLAQATQISLSVEPPVILLDDLASEFDEENFKKVLSLAMTRGGQVWVTGVRLPDWETDHGVFHVEHGRVQEVV